MRRALAAVAPCALAACVQPPPKPRPTPEQLAARQAVEAAALEQAAQQVRVAEAVQNLSPGPADAARWLPAPKDGFVLTLRLYAPLRTPPSALPPGQGSWSPPPLQRLD